MTERQRRSRANNVARSNLPRTNSSRSLDSDDDLLDHPINAETIENETETLCPHATLVVEKMRRRLRFFFMNPIEKWQARRKFPYKFVVQVIKILLVTIQLCLFAHSNYVHVNYAWDNRLSFSHLFLKGWDFTQEVPAYPPATGPLAIYKKDEFFETIDYAMDGYYNISNAIGSYSYVNEDDTAGPVKLCTYHFKEGIVFGFNESYIFNNEIVENCTEIAHNLPNFSSKLWSTENKVPINFPALVRADLKFSVKTVNLKAAGPITPPDCYQFDITIKFDNRDFDGQMLLSLDAEPKRLVCKGDTEYITDNWIDSALRTLLNLLVIFACLLSFVLCSRAIYRAQQLKCETIGFFKKTYGKTLSLEGRLEFLNLWYIMIIINDILIIVGSAVKEQIEKKHFGSDHYNICSVFLGTGNLLIWFGVLRYLTFFRTYNVVILTLKKSTPEVIRFLICAILIYAGFTFCGWLIFGPYHIKFRSLATTSECLFSLINGDDMFATFTIISFKSPILWWYSRIYLYSFISLYIYVILSLFIAVITDAYDTIKNYYKEGFPQNDLQQFVSVCTDEASSGLYRQEGDNCDIMELLNKLCCFKQRRFTPLSEETSYGKSQPCCEGANCI